MYKVLNDAFFIRSSRKPLLKKECTLYICNNYSYIIIFFQAMTIVAATLVDLVRNLKAFAGILIVSTGVVLIFTVYKLN